MGYRTWRVGLGVLIVLVIAAAPIGWAAARSNQPQASAELLVNPGFEEPFTSQGNEISIASGWQAWYVVPDNATYPTRCPDGSPPSCKPYHIPSYRTSQPQPDRIPPRARSGNSQQWGTAWAVYIAGVYQAVGGLTPGTRLRFSAYTQGFNCDDDRGCFGGVGEYGKSYEPGDMQTRVGIDPTGGTNASSPNIVWSGFANPLDVFVLQEVEAVVQGTAVTVFIWSSPTYPELHTDVYVDDASLIVIGQGQTPTATLPPAGTPQPTNTPGTPQPTTTLPPNTGAYTIQSGDTLSVIAERYNLTLDQLLALNPSLTRASLLQVGQVINIDARSTPPPTAPTPVPATVTPTATAAATVATPLTLSTSTPIPNATPALAASGVCLSAYDDPNGNGLRETDEGLVAGVQFTVTDASGQLAASDVSDDVGEPHCIVTLPYGRYVIDIGLPADRIATTDLKWSVSLLSGTRVNVNFGSRAAPAATSTTPVATPGADAEASATPAAPARSTGAPLGLLVGGALVLLAVAAMAFVFSSRRRR
jgi:LysM repeat protein